MNVRLLEITAVRLSKFLCGQWFDMMYLTESVLKIRTPLRLGAAHQSFAHQSFASPSRYSQIVYSVDFGCVFELRSD